MINFKDIPKQKEPSYVFVSTQNLAQLRWQLERNGIRYTVLHRSDAHQMPARIKFPETIPFMYKLDKRRERPTKNVSCIVTHMKKAQFIQRIREMNDTYDPEYLTYTEKEQEKYRKTEECIEHMRELEQEN